ncbi:hypothetical protein ENSA5_34320 [Enhygromyxa salina]|uniref:Uncharacterized protein n=1 Tax=Enhygromyxa salina TaxID=215803 RepID=A0A2S9XXI1_9BACT|nr:hypothetical protein [Enhygromyxa salina]PRP97440.1 hypothetical protein ENSA5_34320 [Enhygromyxa salina]
MDLLDGDPVATVRFFATHAGTPTEDGYPDYGDSQTTRVFVNDMGWQIALSTLYVTTSEVRLVRCQEDSGTAIEMFWGPCPEDFVSFNDLDSVPLGAVTVTDGAYCRVDVTFGPFVAPASADEHIAVGSPIIEDNTIAVIGVARRGEPPMQEEVPFEIVSDAVVTARVDISKLENGGPVRLEDEQFARDLTIIKSYDTMFDGLDFETATPAEIEASVLNGLESFTRAHNGTYDTD